MSDAPPAVPPAETRHDALQALRNAVKLGGSLAATWGIALGVRLLLPRFLGPEGFGPINFADAYTSAFFVVLGLGLDIYIRKEVSVRPEHASDFFAGMILLRIVGAVAVFVAMHLVMVATDRPPEVRSLVYVFGLGQVFFTMNQSLAALLHAKGTVNELSALNVASKLLWGGGVIATVALRWPLVGIPAAFLGSEFVKAAFGWYLVGHHLGVRWRFDPRAVKTVIVASLPIYLNNVAHTAYNKLDVSIIAVVAGDSEVAWYGAASLLAGLTMLISPVIGWVLMPLFSRARSRSEEEYDRVLRRSLELVLIVAFPTSLFVALGADTWVGLLYGAKYAPAAASLRILSPLFLLTYVAMLSSNALILNGRAWAMAAISISGLIANPLLNWLLIPRTMRWFEVGGGGIGAALAQLGTEILVTALMTVLVGRRAFDRRSLMTVARLVLVSLVTVAVDRALGESAAPLRIAVDLVVFSALAVLVRAVHVREIIDFVTSAVRSRKKSAEPEGATP